MARAFAKAFYNSTEWKECRDAYTRMMGGLCEDCLAKGIYTAGKVVHHKVHLSPENINNPEITLGFGNLRLVCQDCHAWEHSAQTADKRYIIAPNGEVLPPIEFQKK